ncbi:hypothetical protein KHS38_08975 [Mucilaginibacter sp. Bleaf8]|uniref:hypothetical protein n=1 Tax=Mucilaginibacter sp. Bleaf8 TaxID=2834430 RepID=UPI001BD0C25B|nr:hypothetical protein [Mucilaginibacter sp. Bleaf8]MBS7564536.1 hypothetical protein [Mucilaginibacter sp. Bleaf8]
MDKRIKHIIIAILLFTGFEGFSQFVPPASFRENRANTGTVRKLDAVKENYVKDKLNLSDSEGAKFWPVYRQYHSEIAEIRRKKRLNNSSAQTNGADQVKMEMYYDEKLVEIKRRYTQEFLKILPPQKVSLIFKSEREFTDELIRQLGERNARPDQY